VCVNARTRSIKQRTQPNPQPNPNPNLQDWEADGPPRPPLPQAWHLLRPPWSGWDPGLLRAGGALLPLHGTGEWVGWGAYLSGWRLHAG